MYEIRLREDGMYACEAMSQSGYERWERPDLMSAVASMLEAAEAINHAEISTADIKFVGISAPPPIQAPRSRLLGDHFGWAEPSPN